MKIDKEPLSPEVRALLSPKEIAAYESHDPERPSTYAAQLKDETHVRRDRRLVSYSEVYAKHQPRVDHPSVTQERRQTNKTLEHLADVDANCVICGIGLNGERRTVVTHADGDVQVRVYCLKCAEAPVEPKSWRDGFTETELAIWSMHAEGRTQSAIGRQFGIGQSKVSRIISRIQAARTLDRQPKKT